MKLSSEAVLHAQHQVARKEAVIIRALSVINIL